MRKGLWVLGVAFVGLVYWRSAALSPASVLAEEEVVRLRAEIKRLQLQLVSPPAVKTIAKSQQQRMLDFEHNLAQYFALGEEDCHTQYIITESFCDASPGNGLKSLLQSILLGFVLNRKLVIAMHRKTQCERFLSFRPGVTVLTYHRVDTPLAYVRAKRTHCSTPTTEYNWKRSPDAGHSLACFDFAHHQSHTTVFRMNFWSELLSDLQFNTWHLSPQELARAKQVFDLGIQTATGMLLSRVFDITNEVKQEFLLYDYKPKPDILAMLKDSAVLKVGMHIRHLPFVVKDEAGSTRNIDKRAFRCLATSLERERQQYTSCLVLIATDIKQLREIKYLDSLLPASQKCVPYFVQRTGFAHTALWGNATQSDWEARPKDDLRAQMEAYLDFFVLSEYSDYMIVGSGSTFSNLVATWNARHARVKGMYEFQPQSCKENYFPYSSCCASRARWADVFVRQGLLGQDCG
ncbi:hypothetical protein BASA81_003663 [Batrachochytrium salamandrivorans]|nr:hypothetical protein BASA81_003663 [Batrachochytrium salamandrivorans]